MLDQYNTRMLFEYLNIQSLQIVAQLSHIYNEYARCEYIKRRKIALDALYIKPSVINIENLLCVITTLRVLPSPMLLLAPLMYEEMEESRTWEDHICYTNMERVYYHNPNMLRKLAVECHNSFDREDTITHRWTQRKKLNAVYFDTLYCYLSNIVPDDAMHDKRTVAMCLSSYNLIKDIRCSVSGCYISGPFSDDETLEVDFFIDANCGMITTYENAFLFNIVPTVHMYITYADEYDREAINLQCNDVYPVIWRDMLKKAILEQNIADISAMLYVSTYTNLASLVMRQYVFDAIEMVVSSGLMRDSFNFCKIITHVSSSHDMTFVKQCMSLIVSTYTNIGIFLTVVDIETDVPYLYNAEVHTPAIDYIYNLYRESTEVMKHT